MFQIQHGVFGIVSTDKIPHGFVILKHVAFFLLVAGKESVKGHDHRQPDFLGNFKGTQIHVIDCLRSIRK